MPLLAALALLPSAAVAASREDPGTIVQPSPGQEPALPAASPVPTPGTTVPELPGSAAPDRPVPTQWVTEIVGGVAEQPPCPVAGLLLWQPRSASGDPVDVTVTGTPGQPVALQGYSRPDTAYRVLRTAVLAADGTARFVLQPSTSTRLYAQQAGCRPSPTAVLTVVAVPSLLATRTATGAVFTGSVRPARAGVLVSLYRRAAGGALVLSGQTRSTASGTYALRRALPAAGRHVFVVRTGADNTNAAGQSPARAVGPARG